MRRCPGPSSLSQRHDSRAAAALIRRRFAESLDVWVAFQQCANGALQRTFAVTVNNADAFDARKICVVKILVYTISRLIHGCTDDVQFAVEILIYVERGAAAARQ